MKFTSFIVLLFLTLTGCSSDKAIKPIDLSGCTDKKYTRVKQLQNVTTIVLARTYTSTNGSSFTNYYLDQPDVAGFAIPWVACNLPDAYKKDKLAVRINGYTLTYQGIESENSIGSPIELTYIEVE